MTLPIALIELYLRIVLTSTTFDRLTLSYEAADAYIFGNVCLCVRAAAGVEGGGGSVRWLPLISAKGKITWP